MITVSRSIARQNAKDTSSSTVQVSSQVRRHRMWLQLISERTHDLAQTSMFG